MDLKEEFKRLPYRRRMANQPVNRCVKLRRQVFYNFTAELW